MSDPTLKMVNSEAHFDPVIALSGAFVEAVGASLTPVKHRKTPGFAGKAEVTPEKLQDPMVSGQEMAQLERSNGGTL